MAAASIEQLMKTPLLAGLTPDEARSIVDIAEERDLMNGAYLFLEGEYGDSLFVVLKGQVAILKKDNAGTQRTIATVGEPALIGEMALLNDKARRSATAKATSSVTAFYLTSSKFRALLARDNVAALKVVHNISKIMAQRVLSMNDQLVNLLAESDGKKKNELGEFQNLLSNWSF